MERFFWVAGALLAGLAVAFGAFGAHALAEQVTEARLQTFETGVRYQMYHALALLFVGWCVMQWGAAFHAVGYLFLSGMVLFSGSLYVLVVTDTAWLGAITPLGGVAFLLGWVWLAWQLARHAR